MSKAKPACGGACGVGGGWMAGPERGGEGDHTYHIMMITPAIYGSACRYEYAGLWYALIFADHEGIKRHSQVRVFI